MARKRYKAEEIVAKLRQTPTRNMPSNPVSIQHQRHARLLSKDTLQAAGTIEQAVGTLQAYRTSM